ncbi:MAG: hypothetical protein R3D30_10890 [Hyphomicrobiales bacterium]
MASGLRRLWWLAFGASWQTALTYAIAVLIITCPCALALAVPAVQIAAASRLFKRGIVVRRRTRLERIAEIDTVVFDKTARSPSANRSLSMAPTFPTACSRARRRSRRQAGILMRGRLSRARNSGSEPCSPRVASRKLPGEGSSESERLGSAAWCGAEVNGEETEVLYRRGATNPCGFASPIPCAPMPPRPSPKLKRRGYGVALLRRPDRGGGAHRTRREVDGGMRS